MLRKDFLYRTLRGRDPIDLRSHAGRIQLYLLGCHAHRRTFHAMARLTDRRGRFKVLCHLDGCHSGACIFLDLGSPKLSNIVRRLIRISFNRGIHDEPYGSGNHSSAFQQTARHCYSHLFPRRTDFGGRHADPCRIVNGAYGMANDLGGERCSPVHDIRSNGFLDFGASSAEFNRQQGS